MIKNGELILCSEHRDQLAAAMVLARLQYKPVKRNSINTHTKKEYADIHAITDATYEALCNNGVMFSQGTLELNDRVLLYSEILHAKSNQFQRSFFYLKFNKPDDQGIGTTLKYQRRYQAEALLNITVDQDPEDDDGNSTSAKIILPPKPPVKTVPTSLSTPTENKLTVTPEQLEILTKKLMPWPDIADRMMVAYKVKSLKDMPRASFTEYLEQLEKMITNRLETKQ